jgi:hypothetical protein
MNALFEKEQKVYDSHLLTWQLASMGGLVVIIKDENILGYAGTVEQAYTKALGLLGNQPFFLKEIE